MKKLLFLSIFATTTVVAAESECFLDYNSVCGKNSQGQVSEYLNRCHLDADKAKPVDMALCQSNTNRGPASIDNTVYDQLKLIENEIASLPEETPES